MLKKILTGVLGLLLVSLPGKAAVIALWDFEGQSTASSYSPSSGTQAGTATLGTFTGTQSINSGGDDFLDFSTLGSFVIQVSGSGLVDFMITYEGKRDAGTVSQTWAYSINGSDFTDLGTQPASLTTGAFASRTVDFSSISAIEGAPNVYFRLTFDGGSDYDDISVSAVPEPVNVALACFGLAFVGLTFGRRLYAMARGQRPISA